MFEGLDVPESWKDESLLNQEITLVTTIARAVAIHGNLVLALKHPQNTGAAAVVVAEVLEELEGLFRFMGMEEPATGWRGAPAAPKETPAPPQLWEERPLPLVEDLCGAAHPWLGVTCDRPPHSSGGHYEEEAGFWFN